MKKYLILLIIVLPIITLTGCKEKSNNLEYNEEDLLHEYNIQEELIEEKNLIVKEKQVLIFVKNNEVINIWPANTYELTEENLDLVKNNTLYYLSLEENTNIEINNEKTIQFNNSTNLNIKGNYSYKIVDPTVFINNFLEYLKDNQTKDYNKYISSLITNIYEETIKEYNGKTISELENNINNIKYTVQDKLNMRDYGIYFTNIDNITIDSE